MFCFNVLSDGDDQHIARYVDVLFTCRSDARASVADLAYHLRSHIDSLNMVVLIQINRCRSLQCLNLDSFRDGSLYLVMKGGHVRDPSAVNDTDLLCSQTFCRAHSVHGYIAAADDGNFFSGQIHDLIHTHVSQKFNCRQDAVGIFPFNAKLLVCACAYGDQNRVILLLNLLDRNICPNLDSVLYFYAGL